MDTERNPIERLWNTKNTSRNLQYLCKCGLLSQIVVMQQHGWRHDAGTLAVVFEFARARPCTITRHFNPMKTWGVLSKRVHVKPQPQPIAMYLSESAPPPDGASYTNIYTHNWFCVANWLFWILEYYLNSSVLICSELRDAFWTYVYNSEHQTKSGHLLEHYLFSNYFKD